MSTPHNEANPGDIAKTVVMPGDPLRAKYIAENFLENPKLVNSVRNMYAYTGTYKGKELTVMASGMGMPSMGIYSYELYKYYGVENIIRIGSCGAYSPDLKLFDVILSKRVYSESNFALTFNNDDCHIVESNEELNIALLESAKESNIKVTCGDTITTDSFDLYITNLDKFLERLPSDISFVAAEMEAFALLYTAKVFNKNAACIMSVVDSKYLKEVATPEEREKKLNAMIKIALDATLKI